MCAVKDFRTISERDETREDLREYQEDRELIGNRRSSVTVKV